MPQVLSTTPTFDPFSLDEIMKVPIMIKQEQDKIVEDYNKEADKIQQLRNIAALHPEVQPMIDEYDASMNTLAEAVQDGNIGDMRGVLQRARQGYRDLSKIKDYADIWDDRMKYVLAESTKRPGRILFDPSYNLQSIAQDASAVPQVLDLDILDKELATYGIGYSQDLYNRFVDGDFAVTSVGMPEMDQNIFRNAMLEAKDNDNDFKELIKGASTPEIANVMYAMRDRLKKMAESYGFDNWEDQMAMMPHAIEVMLANMPYTESATARPRVSVSTGGSRSSKSGNDGDGNDPVNSSWGVYNPMLNLMLGNVSPDLYTASEYSVSHLNEKDSNGNRKFRELSTTNSATGNLIRSYFADVYPGLDQSNVRVFVPSSVTNDQLEQFRKKLNMHKKQLPRLRDDSNPENKRVRELASSVLEKELMDLNIQILIEQSPGSSKTTGKQHQGENNTSDDTYLYNPGQRP